MVKEVVDVEKYLQRKNVEVYKNKMFNQQKKIPKAAVNIKSNSAAM